MLPVQELESSPWFRNAKGIASLVADAMEGGAHTLSDVAAALQASHLLVWQHEVEHGEAFHPPASSTLRHLLVLKCCSGPAISPCILVMSGHLRCRCDDAS